MARSNGTKSSTRSSRPATVTNKQLRGFKLDHVCFLTEHPKAYNDFQDFMHMPGDTELQLFWEFHGTEETNDFVFATFSVEQLLKIAIERGMLTEITSSERPLPKGKLPQVAHAV